MYARLCLSLLVCVATPAIGHIQAAAPQPVEVMVLGTFHLDNPGQDEHNVQVDSPLSPNRQRELQEVTDRLARFRPTKIIVEAQPTTPDLTLTSYRSFTSDMLTQKGKENEIFQIGYRLAKQLGHQNVYGIDERQGSGEPSYWQYDKVRGYAEQNGRGEELEATKKIYEVLGAEFEALQKTHTIAQLLAKKNEPASFKADHATYYADLAFGDFDNQPGAEHNAYWYMRNAKSFAKLVRLAVPGDRVLVIFGTGHGFWLRHFAEHMPGYKLVEPVPYLTGNP